MAEVSPTHKVHLSRDWDGTKVVVTVRPEIERAVLGDARRALHDVIPLLRDEEDTPWRGISAPGEARLIKMGAPEDVLKLAGTVACEALTANGLVTEFDESQGVQITPSGYID